MKRRFSILTAALALLTFLAVPMGMWGQTRESYNVTYSYDDLGDMLYGSYLDASSYWKVPETSGNNAIVSIPITYQPESNITVTFRIATFGSGNNPSSSNTTVTAVGTETGSNWSGSGVSSYPSSSTYVNAVMTITKPQNPTTLAGLDITMGVNTGVKILRLQSISISYTYTPGGDIPTPTTYTVTYDANGGTGTMTDSDSPYTAGATVTVLGNEFTRTDYEFDHWNTAADDNGDSYDENDTFTINANTTLYAQWTENTTPGPGGDTETVIIDFEDNQLPSGWTVSNFEVVSNPISGTSATNGSYACSTGGKASASLTSNNSFENVVSISIDASKTSTNTNTSLYIDFCPDSNFGNGNTQTQQVTNIPRNSWETTTLALSSATTGYVRIRWAGTTAVKYIDNIVITCESSGGTSAPSISADDVNIAYDATSGSFNYTINNPVQGGYLTVDENVSWISNPSAEDGVVNFDTETNPNTVSREGIIRMRYLYDGEILIHNVTITQTAALYYYSRIVRGCY